MGFIENKTSAINNVSLFEVLGNLPKGKITSSLESVNSKSKNLVPFLIDLLSTTCKDNARDLRDKAKCEATRIVIEILIEFFPVLLRILKEGIIKAIKAGLACGVDFTIPAPAPQITLKIDNIDFLNLLKIDPNSDIGSMYYGISSEIDLNWFIYDLIQIGGSDSWKSIIDFNFDQNNENLTIKVNDSYIGKNFNEFLIDFINSIELLNLEGFITKLTNFLTGNLDASLGMSLDKLIAIEKVNKLQDKINDSDPCKEDYQFDNSYYSFTNEEVYEIEKIAEEKSKGVTIINLCGLTPVTVDPTISKSVFNDVRNTPASKINDVVTRSINTINNNLTSNVPEPDKHVAKLSLNVDFINSIPKILTNVILEPKIVVLYQISLKTVNNIILNVTNAFDYAKATKVFFEFVVRESLAALLEIIFRKIKVEVMKLVADTAAKIIKEQTNLKIKAIASIVTGVVENIIATIPTPNTSEFT